MHQHSRCLVSEPLPSPSPLSDRFSLTYAERRNPVDEHPFFFFLCAFCQRRSGGNSVMDAWGKWSNVGDKLIMAADGNGDFVTATGLAQGKVA